MWYPWTRAPTCTRCRPPGWKRGVYDRVQATLCGRDPSMVPFDEFGDDVIADVQDLSRKFDVGVADDATHWVMEGCPEAYCDKLREFLCSRTSN